jgi:hypothetical protein
VGERRQVQQQRLPQPGAAEPGFTKRSSSSPGRARNE